MAVIVGRTLRQLRQGVGRNLGPGVLFIGSTTSTGDSSSVIDSKLRGGNDEHNGKYLISISGPAGATAGSVLGGTSRIDDYEAGTAFDMTLDSVLASSIPSGMDYELWKEPYSPVNTEDYINQAIIDATGHVYDDEEDLTLFADGKTLRFDVPGTLAMINRIQYRLKVSSTKIDNAEAVWTAGSNVTVSVDTKDKKQGTSSMKIVLAAGVSAGDVVAYKDFTAIDISGHDTIELWVKCTKVLGGGDLKLLLDNTAGSVSPLETLNMPALSANTWRYARLSLAAAKDDTAIISVGLEDDTDIGVATVWLDRIMAITQDTERWETLPKHLWSIDKEARDLVLTDGGRATVGESPLKLTGGDKPVLLSADTDVCEIDDWYVIARATELALAAHKGAAHPDAQVWAARAERAKRAFPFLVNTRTVA